MKRYLVWHRGTPPASWTRVEEATDDPLDELGERLEDLRRRDHLPVAGYAPGGARNSDPRLRGIGWSCQVVRDGALPEVDADHLVSRGGGIPRKQAIHEEGEECLNFAPLRIFSDSK
eukprot:7032461-Pyramimonas_sp.AAC.1